MVHVSVCILCGAKELDEERKNRRSRRSLCVRCTHLLLRGALADPHVLAETMRLIHAPKRKSPAARKPRRSKAVERRKRAVAARTT